MAEQRPPHSQHADWSRAAARLLLELRPPRAPWRRPERSEGEGDAGVVVVVVDVGQSEVKVRVMLLLSKKIYGCNSNPNYQNNFAAHVCSSH